MLAVRRHTWWGFWGGAGVSGLLVVLMPSASAFLVLLTVAVLSGLSAWVARTLSRCWQQRSPMIWFVGGLTAVWVAVVGLVVRLTLYEDIGSAWPAMMLLVLVFGGIIAGLIGALTVGFLAQAFSTSQLEQRALEADLHNGLVVLPEGRLPQARPAPRWLNGVAALGVAGLVGWPLAGLVSDQLGGQAYGAMSVGAALVLVGGLAGVLRKPNVFSPQRGVVFSPWAALRDAILPWMSAWLCLFWLGRAVSGGDLWVLSDTAFVFWGGALAMQIPWLICAWERHRWVLAWKEDASPALPDHVLWSTRPSPPRRVGSVSQIWQRSSADSAMSALDAPFSIEALHELRITPISAGASSIDRSESATSDPQFDSLFRVEGSAFLVHAVFDARVRRALTDAHPFAVALAPGLLRCELAHPWQALRAAATLSEARAALLATAPPDEANHNEHLRARLLHNALHDPHAGVRLACANTLLERYLRAPETLQLLHTRLGHDPASVRLIQRLGDLLSSATLEALVDASAWPTPDTQIAQTLWCVMLEALPPEHARWVLSPVRGRLASLSLPLSMRLVEIAGRVQATQAEPLLLALWSQNLSHAQRRRLVDGLAQIGSHLCLPKLQALAGDDETPASLSAAARQAAALIVQRLGLSPGELSLVATDDAGALALTDR